jgi:NADPH:quinone reductase-like Zn-dependent oxidoreductase
VAGAGGASTGGLVVGMVGARLRARLGRGRVEHYLARLTQEHLAALAALAQDGRLIPAIGGSVAFEQVPAALDALADGHARGKTVVEVGRA